jgi:hypothetical protein
VNVDALTRRGQKFVTGSKAKSGRRVAQLATLGAICKQSKCKNETICLIQVPMVEESDGQASTSL